MTPTAYCRLVESRLGWEAPPGAEWVRYRAEAAKVTRKIATDPELYTWANLQLAVAFCARQKISRSPVGVFAYVEPAQQVAREHDPDVEVEIWRAVLVESAKGDPDGWVGRFSRTTGAYRAEALAEWAQQ